MCSDGCFSVQHGTSFVAWGRLAAWGLSQAASTLHALNMSFTQAFRPSLPGTS